MLDVLGLAGNLQTAELMECLLRRDTQSALLTLDRLYSSGKDVGAMLNELSTLTRDLLIRMTAPEGGAALLSGGYDDGLMDSLSQGVSPTRLLFMASQLQSVSASLPLSPNRRTDAELCLMRLCDESLCGDVTALAARLARLEEGGLPAGGRETAGTVVQPPARRLNDVPGKPVSAPRPQPKPAPVPAPADDPPPWDEEAPPLPEAPPDMGPPPWDEEPPPPPTPVQERPARRKVGVPVEPPKPQKAQPAPGGGCGWTWWRNIKTS